MRVPLLRQRQSQIRAGAEGECRNEECERRREAKRVARRAVKERKREARRALQEEEQQQQQEVRSFNGEKQVLGEARLIDFDVEADVDTDGQDLPAYAPVSHSDLNEKTEQ